MLGRFAPCRIWPFSPFHGLAAGLGRYAPCRPSQGSRAKARLPINTGSFSLRSNEVSSRLFRHPAFCYAKIVAPASDPRLRLDLRLYLWVAALHFVSLSATLGFAPQLDYAAPSLRSKMGDFASRLPPPSGCLERGLTPPATAVRATTRYARKCGLRLLCGSPTATWE
jgi:hypothetical protein